MPIFSLFFSLSLVCDNICWPNLQSFHCLGFEDDCASRPERSCTNRYELLTNNATSYLLISAFHGPYDLSSPRQLLFTLIGQCFVVFGKIWYLTILVVLVMVISGITYSTVWYFAEERNICWYLLAICLFCFTKLLDNLIFIKFHNIL